MNLKIRQAQIEDAHDIAQAEREIAEEPGFFCSQPSELTDQNVINTISKILKDKSGVYLVAACDGAIVGHAFLEPLPLKSLCHVAQLTVVVHKGWQEKGIGRQLIENLLEWANQSKTIEKIELNVRATNSRAIALYTKMGFREEGRLKNRVKVGDSHYIDDILMGIFIKNLEAKRVCIHG